MAEPLTRPAGPGAITIMEEAAQLLRQTPLGTLACHSIGSVPLALGLLVFWNNLTTQRLTDVSCALQAFALTMLLVWMNCWRAVFAGHLRRQLDGTTGTRWNWGRATRLAAGQAFLGGTKLVILPLAALVGFPLAAATAFYRNAATLADRDDLDLLQLITKARALARLDPRQSWAILPALAFVQVVVAVNLALTFAMLPLLARMLTGYESDFNRSGIFFVESPLFLVFVLVSAWVVFDPFVQAVYCVRCFHGESVSSGEDVRVALRRIRAAQVLAAMLLLAVFPMRAAEAVSPGELARSAQHAMQAPEYAWRIPPPPVTGISGRPWALRLADKVLDLLNSMWRAIGNAIGKVFEWLFGKLGKAPSPGNGTAPGAALHWSIYLLMAVVAAAGLWIAWRRRMFRRPATQAAAVAGMSISLDQDGVTADQLPEERWIEMAIECLRREDYRLALRAFYLANLAWLGQRGFIAIHAGKTNREYELELRRKARQFAEASGLFGANISAFEAAWYGMHEVSSESVAQFRERLDGMKKAMA